MGLFSSNEEWNPHKYSMSRLNENVQPYAGNTASNDTGVYDFVSIKKKVAQNSGRASESGIQIVNPLANVKHIPLDDVKQNLENYIGVDERLNPIINPVDDLQNIHVDPLARTREGKQEKKQQPKLEDASGPASFELRHIKEGLGATMADQGRRGIGAGDGISYSDDEQLIANSAGIQYGPVSVSNSNYYSDDLYDQGFISMSGVPVVKTGTYTDPMTGEEYEAFESALPPPDNDYGEQVNCSGRNVQLDMLQGGWSNNTARRTKTEVLQDDSNLQYDRTIGAFGAYDYTEQKKLLAQNNMFKMDDYTPDPDGAEMLDHLPANQDGIYNQKIRPMPFMKPTMRGKHDETSFRGNVDPTISIGNDQSFVPQTYTSFPQLRKESTRVDGGGMEVTANTSGFMHNPDFFDMPDTQRSMCETEIPNQGPVEYVRLTSNVGQEVYEVSTKNTGQTLLDDTISGTYGVDGYGHQLYDGTFEDAMKNTGLDDIDFTEFASISVNGGDFVGTTGVHPTQAVKARFSVPLKSTGLINLDYTDTPSVQAQNMYASQLMDQHVSSIKTKNEAQNNNDFGSHGGVSGAAPVPTFIEKQNTKNEAQYFEQWGSHGGMEGTNRGPVRLAIEKQNTKNEAQYSEQWGSHGGMEGTNRGPVKALIEKQSTKLEQQNKGNYGSGGGEYQQSVKPSYFTAKDKTKRQLFQKIFSAFDTMLGNNTAYAEKQNVTKVNTKKGKANEIAIPSGTVNGNDLNHSRISGAQTFNTKRGVVNKEITGFAVHQPNDTLRYSANYNVMEKQIRPSAFAYPTSSANSALFLRQQDIDE